jgi:hypothetical protein
MWSYFCQRDIIPAVIMCPIDARCPVVVLSERHLLFWQQINKFDGMHLRQQKAGTVLQDAYPLLVEPRTTTDAQILTSTERRQRPLSIFLGTKCRARFVHEREG